MHGLVCGVRWLRREYGSVVRHDLEKSVWVSREIAVEDGNSRLNCMKHLEILGNGGTPRLGVGRGPKIDGPSRNNVVNVNNIEADSTQFQIPKAGLG